MLAGALFHITGGLSQVRGGDPLMTESLLELTAEGSVRKIVKRRNFPNSQPRLKEGEDHLTKFLQIAIGREIRSIRTKHGMTASELATAAGLSASMLSKVENGGISSSLNTLQTLSTVLGVPLSALFQRFGGKNRAVFVKADAGASVDPHKPSARHWWSLLEGIESSSNGVRIEPYLITLSKLEDEFPAFDRVGIVFFYMLEGEMVYLHDDCLYRLTPGDSLLFNAGVLISVES